MGVRWQDGRLAAKQLFDGLEANGIDPKSCSFGNAFLINLDKTPTVKPWLKRTVTRALARGEEVVALGQLVSRVLQKIGVTHVTLIHPAARGKIRKKSRYAAHVRSTLKGNL